jgi:ASC-1-like (ASCH) protein
MNIWYSGRESYLVDDIIAGHKTIEGRLKRGKFANYAVGDIVMLRRDYRDKNGVLQDGADYDTKVQITNIKQYGSFKDMFKYEDYRQALPRDGGLKEVIETYYKYYTKEEQQKYGVLAIHINYAPRE